ncbi:MAG: uracil-DNA glycosylase [Yoonia sp.]|jgi:uracil-DNA glycosylase
MHEQRKLDWQTLLGAEKEKEYFKSLLEFVQSRRNDAVKVFPNKPEVYNAFALTPCDQVKVVILGQDPYHGEGQAHGLCFSVQNGVKIPPSLRNIYKELSADIEGFIVPKHGNLTNWARQGILMINTVMTVDEANANSHKGKGWEQFTDTVIAQVSEHLHDVIFLLWGKPAQQKIKLIDTSKHHVLMSVHPSPLSAHRGFLGCKHFSQVNELLIKLGKNPIDWQVP